MSKMFQVYGIGQALIPVLPPPLAFENPPTSNQTNYEIGQVVYTPPHNPTDFYVYAGGGNWSLFSSGSGSIISVVGTANQITVTTASGIATLSLPAAITAPGSLTTVSTLASGTTLTVGTKLLLTASSGAASITGTTPAMTTGAVTVASTAVTANSIILYSVVTPGGTVGTYTLTKSAGSSFTITSTSGTETSTFNYLIIN